MNATSQPLIYHVEDNESTFKLIHAQLLAYFPTMQLKHFRTGEECMASLEKRPDLILLDYFLPQKNGMEILKTLQNENADIPVVIISGQKDARTAIRLLRAGSIWYYSKDEPVIELVQVIKALLREGENFYPASLAMQI